MRNIVRDTAASGVKYAAASGVKYAAAGAVLGGSLLFTAGLGLAAAVPPASNAVDLAIGNIKILQNASLDTAVSVAGAVCHINTAPGNSPAHQATPEGSAQTLVTSPPAFFGVRAVSRLQVAFSYRFRRGTGADSGRWPGGWPFWRHL